MMPLFRVGDILYRAEAHVFNTELGLQTRVRFVEWMVVHTTRHIMWLSNHPLTQAHSVELVERDRGSLKRCKQRAHVKFAWRSKREALESLMARTHMRVCHAERRLEEAKAAKRALTTQYPNLLNENT